MYFVPIVTYWFGKINLFVRFFPDLYFYMAHIHYLHCITICKRWNVTPNSHSGHITKEVIIPGNLLTSQHKAALLCIYEFQAHWFLNYDQKYYHYASIVSNNVNVHIAAMQFFKISSAILILFSSLSTIASADNDDDNYDDRQRTNCD